MRHTVPVQSALQILTAASARVPERPLLDEAQIDAQELVDPAGRIAVQKLVALYEAAAHLTDDSSFGLNVGARSEFRFFGILGHLVRNSPTLGEALGRMERYFPLWTEGASLRLARDRFAVALGWQYTDGMIGECRQDCEMTLAAIATNLRRLVPIHDWRPREVHFQHGAPRDRTVHARVFGAPVRFGMPTNAIILDERTLSSTIGNIDAELSEVLIAHAEQRLESMASSRSLGDRARMAIAQSLSSGDACPELADLARRIGVSERTLQRRLREEGTSFRALVAAVRRQLAERYLADPGLGIGQVAHRLGYAHTSELHRAFRDWTGVAPTHWRLRRRR